MMAWNHKLFGTEAQPIRQSALNDLASQNGCARRFQLDRIAEADGRVRPDSTHWRTCLGTAVHAVIERGLTRTWPVLVQAFGPGSTRPMDAREGWAPQSLRLRVDEVLREELSAAAKGQPVSWYDEDPEAEIAAGVAMVLGALRTAVERADSIVACEAPFRAELDGYHLEGTIDLVYRPREAPDTISLADWKTGERKLPQVVLDHGYQLAIYAHALEHGVLWPGTDRETRLSQWPSQLHIVHLRDFVPYVKKPRTAGKRVGDLRGPGWSPSQRTQADVARLRVSLRTIVGTVRMGRFIEQLGEQCVRCSHRAACLNDGHGPSREEQRELAAALSGIDVGDGGLGEEAA